MRRVIGFIIVSVFITGCCRYKEIREGEIQGAFIWPGYVLINKIVI